MGTQAGMVALRKFRQGITLSPKKAIMAQCYSCNGEGEGSGIDCQGTSCPLYPLFRKWKMGKAYKKSPTLSEVSSASTE